MALATNTTEGEIVLSGDLTGSSMTPQLRASGVNPGTYLLPTIVVDNKGRIIHVINSLDVYATTTSKGVVQIGSNINVSSGVISVPDATTSTKGAVQVGSGLSVTSGVLSANIPDATTSTKGVVQVGSGLSVTGGVLSANIPDATTSTKGVVQVGSNINVSSGVISVPDATTSTKGVVQVGSGLSVTGGVLSAPDATTTSKGVVKSANSNYITITAGDLNVGPNVAKTDVNNTFTKAQYSNIITLTDAPTINVNASLGNIFTVTINANRTLANPTNLAPGAYTFIIKQNSIGGYSLTYSSSYKFKQGFISTISSSPNSTTIITCISDGTNLFCSVGKDFV